jgi:ribonuclease J
VGSERTVGPVLRDIIEAAPRLVVAACFASHIHRIQQICDAAGAVGRKVAFLGRSMLNAVEQATALERFHVPEEQIVDIDSLKDLDPRSVAVVCTGSQGEPMSALSLMAGREHKYVHLEDGDTVILSASVIPGNETAIHRVIDGLFRTGADVYHVGIAPVHVSGHAAADELKLMISLVQPRWFIPIHGELRHLATHARLARDVGIPSDRILICEDGDVVEIGEQLGRGEPVQTGMSLVDGLGIGDVGEAVLRDRRKLAGDGVVVVVVTTSANNGEVLAGPDIITRGFVHDEASEEILEEARHRAALSLKEVAVEDVRDLGIMKQHVRRALGRYFFDVLERKPIIVPVIMEV